MPHTLARVGDEKRGSGPTSIAPDLALSGLGSILDARYSHVSHSWSMGGGMNVEGINLKESHNPLLDFAPPIGRARSGTEVDQPQLAPNLAAAAGLDVYRVIREHVSGPSRLPGLLATAKPKA